MEAINGWPLETAEEWEERIAVPEVPNAVEFTRKWLGFEPDERQAEVLLSESKRGILNCTRQWGKSTVFHFMLQLITIDHWHRSIADLIRG